MDALEKKPAESKPESGDQSPQTGVNNSSMLWFALLFISGGAVIGTTVVSKKKKHSVR